MKDLDYIPSLFSDQKAAEYRANVACKWITEIVPDQKDVRILDVGCGLGQLMSRLHQIGYVNLFGLDNSAAAVQRINTRMQHAFVQQFDIEKDKLPFIDEYFDVVICMEVFEHLYDPVSVMNDIVRVIRPGGFGVFSFPNEYRLTQRINFLQGKSISSPFQVGGHIKFFNYDLVTRFVNEKLNILTLKPIGNERVRKLPFLQKLFPALFAKWFFVLAQRPVS